MHEDDFRVRSQTIERYGASAIPEDSSLTDWPLTYADLEPYYDRAEYEIGVSGKAGNLQGRKIDGGNVFEAPRHRDYPLPPLLLDQVGLIFDEAAAKLGYHPFSTPRAILSQAYKGRRAAPIAASARPSAATSAPKSIDPGHQAAGGGRDRQLQALTGAMVYRVNSDNRAARPASRITGRTAPTTPSRRSSSSSRRSSTTTRGCSCCRRRTNSRTGSPIPAAMSASIL